MSTTPPEPPAPLRRPPRPPAPGAPGLVRTAAGFYALLLLAALAWRTGWAGEPLLYANAAAAARGVSPVSDVAAGLAAAGVVIAASWVLTRATAWGDRLARALAGILGRPGLGAIAVLALSSGIAEEAFFRGALQPRVGWVAASVLFAGAHFLPRREFLPWTAFSLVAGLLLGALFDWTGNLIAPVVAHAAINGVNLTLLVRDYGVRDGSADERDGVDLDRGSQG